MEGLHVYGVDKGISTDIIPRAIGCALLENATLNITISQLPREFSNRWVLFLTKCWYRHRWPTMFTRWMHFSRRTHCANGACVFSFLTADGWNARAMLDFRSKLTALIVWLYIKLLRDEDITHWSSWDFLLLTRTPWKELSILEPMIQTLLRDD